MDKLLSFLNSLAPPAQVAFARDCKTSVGYLRKAISKGQKLGEDLCIRIEIVSKRVVRVEDLRPDLTELIAYLRESGGASALHEERASA